MMYPKSELTALSSAKHHEAAEYLGLEEWGTTNKTKSRSGIYFRPLKRLIQRHWLLIAVPTVLSASATAILVLLSPPTFSGRFQALVEPLTTEAKVSQPVLTGGKPVPSSGMDYSSLISVFTSRKVLEGVVAQLDDQYPEMTYNTLVKGLKVQRLEGNGAEKTKILDVTYQSTNTTEILDVLKTLQTNYPQFLLADRNRQVTSSLAVIEQQLPSLQRRVQTVEGQLQALQQQHNLSDLGSEGSSLAKQAHQLQAQQAEAQRDLAAQAQLYRNLQQQLGGLTPAAAIAASSLSENPRYQMLLNQLKQLEVQIAIDSAQFQLDYPGLQTLQEQRNNLLTLLRQESQRLVGNTPVPQFQTAIQQNMSQQLVDTLNQMKVLETRSQALSQANATVEQRVREFPAIQRRYNELQAQLEIDRNTLKQLQLKRENAKVEVVSKDSLWQMLVNPELIQDEQGNPIPAARNRWPKILLGAFGGMLLGAGCALLREKRRDIFFSLEDLQEDVNWPLLGALPTTEVPPRQLLEAESSTEKVRLAPSLLMTAAASLYANLKFLPLEPGIRSLVITSGMSHDGKTTVAVYLAKAAAVMGQRVLLVDANLTLPQAHLWLDVPNFEGLHEVLTHHADPNQLIQRSPYQSNLFILAAGQVSPAARQLVASQQMQHLMSQLHSMFDLVLYDTLALQNAPDANFLGRHADGLLVVTSLKQTRRSLLLTLLKKVRGARIPVVGVVANRVPSLSTTQAAELGAVTEHINPDDEFEIFRIPPMQE
jgi:capsular exopolysaccharide synthesis family protein